MYCTIRSLPDDRTSICEENSGAAGTTDVGAGMSRRSIAAGVVGISCALLAGCGGGGGGGGGQPNPSGPTSTFTIAGTVNGLAGSGLVLQLNGGNNLSVAQGGSFSFANALASGAVYSVTVLTQPSGPIQACTVASGSGTISANVTNVVVTCVTNAFTVGGMVSGLAANASGLVLTNSGGDNKSITTNGAFVFDTPVAIGGSYDIRVLSQPYDPYQICTVANGTGSVTNTSITAPAIACTTLVPKFATSLDSTTSSYSQYVVDLESGQLRQRGYAKVGGNPIDLAAYGFDSKISFILSRNTSSLHAFARDGVSGRITEGPNSPQVTGGLVNPSPTPNPSIGPASLTLHPRLNFVYVANGGGTTSVSGYTFNTTSGALTPITGSPFVAGPRPIKLTVDPTGRFAYVANRDDETLNAYSVDQTTGALTAIGSAISVGGTNVTFPAVHPSGRFLYVPNAGGTSATGVAGAPGGTISAYTIGANGALTPMTNSPFSIATTLTAPIFFHPNGKNFYVRVFPTGNVAGSIIAGAIDPSTGALSLIGSPVAVGINPQTVTPDPSYRYLFVANRGPTPQTASTIGSISVLKIDQASGALTLLPGVDNLAPPPYSATLDGSGKYLYSASAEGNLVRTYGFNMTTGALTPLARATSKVRGGPITLVTIPSSNAQPAKFSSKFAYVPNSAAATISAFSINAIGALTTTTGVGSSPSVPSFDAVAIAPGSSRLVALNAGSTSDLRTYPIDTQTGALGASSAAVEVGATPHGLVAEPSGRFAYAADLATDSIQAFTINAANGGVQSIPATSPTVGDVRALAIHPNGRHLYYITDTRWGVKHIDPTSGAFTTSYDTPTVAGTKTAIAIHPSGRFAYVTRGSSGVVEIYSIDVPSGELNGPVINSTLGNDPVSIAIDPTGRYAYIAHSTSSTIAAFSIDADTGVLTPATATPISVTSPPRSVRVSYNGEILYAVVDASQVLSFTIDDSTGALTAVAATGPAVGNDPRDLALSEDVE